LGWALWRALDRIHYPFYEQTLLEPFEGTITREMLQQIRAWLPKSNADTYRPEQFTDRQFPFEAYTVSVPTVPQPPQTAREGGPAGETMVIS
jgi:hypothetical protein